MSDAPPPDEALTLLGDEYARRILIATRSEPMTANELADTIDAAASTVYDRIEDLEAAGFLLETARVDDDGNHYAEYEARVRGVDVAVTEDGFDVAVDLEDRDEAAERLHSLWRDVR